MRGAALAVVLLAAGLAGCAAPTDVTDSAGGATAPPAAPAEGAAVQPAQMPDIALPTLSGEGTVDLAGPTPTPRIVNVWASWCGPCRAEIPALARFARESAGDVQVLGVDFLDDPEAAADLLAELGADYSNVVDHDGATRGPLRISGPPVTFFVLPDGSVAHRVDGGIDTVQQWRALAAEHLGYDS